MEDDEGSPASGLELRVHGVHGTSPSSMLGLAAGDIEQVAGDGLTGIFRAAPQARLPERDLPPRFAVEAYSWGALTSGVQGALGWVKRVLWLILLPFALANLAYWARLEVGLHTARSRWGVRAARTSALLLTVLMVLTPCVVAIDLLGWQCYRGFSNGCPSLPGQFDFLASMGPTRRIAVGSLVPLLAIVVLYLLSRQTLIRYEEVIGPLSTTETTEHSDQTVLTHPNLWRGKKRGVRLQRLHLTVALATVVCFGGIHLLHARGLPSSGPFWLVWVTVLVSSASLVGGFLLVCVIDEQDVEYAAGSTFGGRPMAWMRATLPSVALAVMVGCVVVYLVVLAFAGFGGVRENIDFYGHNLWFIAVFVALTATHLSLFVGGRMRTVPALSVVLVVVVLGVLGLLLHARDGFNPTTLTVGGIVVGLFYLALLVWHYRTTRWNAMAWRGAGASVLLATAAWVGLLFTSAAVTASANYLNGTSHSVADLVTRLTPVERATLQHRYLTGAQVSSTALTASGHVVLRDAVIDLSGAVPTVVSGTIQVDQLSRLARGSAADQGILEVLGTSRVTEGRVVLPDRTVSLEDSCPRATTHPGCTAESPDFITAGILPTDGQRLDIAAAHGRVLISVASPPQVPLVVPQVLIWTPIIQLLWLVLSGLAVAVCLLLFRFKVRGPVRDLALTRSGPGRDSLDLPDRNRAPAAGARTRAALAHRAERLLDVVGAITSPVALALILLSSTGEPPWQLWAWSRHLATLSLYAVLALSAGMVFVGSRLRRSESTRKTVGIIWDLTTFWPRAAHPLAPPCYAERVIPELLTRVYWALDRPDDPAKQDVVVLSGHSQGSAIVVAAASRLPDESLARVRLITYGSQIRALYGRVFPRVMGADAMGYRATTGAAALTSAFPDVPSDPGSTAPVPSTEGLRHRLGDDRHWVNLFRRSDPLGYRVFSDDDSADDVPVLEVPPGRAGDPGPRLMTHSGYPHSPEYRAVVGRWTGERFVGLPSGTTGVPALPAE
ncbi:MAG: hypothetical protein ACRDPI_03285 [Nocardioidaceae bacterium]